MLAHELVQQFGIVVYATQKETPCGNNYVVTWNGNSTFHLHCVIEGDIENVDIRNFAGSFMYPDKVGVDVGEVVVFAHNWINEIIAEEQASVIDELLEG